MNRKPLGRGLSALIGEAAAEAAEERPAASEIDVDLIGPNPHQPRTRFDSESLDELTNSVVANGVIQPIVVRQIGSRYEIVAGERRWRAAQKAGLRKIPAVVRPVSDEKLLELALVENIQRQELNPIDEARAYRKLIDTIGLTQEQVSERVGKDRSMIATSMRLLKLPDDITKLIEEGKLSAGHGRALLLTDDPAVQRLVARRIIEYGLSVREAERAIKKARPEPRQIVASKNIKQTRDPNVAAAETKLQRRLGTHVSILPKQNSKGGKIEIEYYTPDDLYRIYELLIK